MSDLTISQDAEGTLLHGSSRDDGTAAVVQPRGWRWSSRINAWYWPRTRRILTGTQLDLLAAALRDAGHTVTVERQDATVAEREAALVERLDGRHEALTAKAERKAGEFTEQMDRAHQLSDMIPFGQPILVGHHSEKRHRNHLKRIDRLQGKASESYDASKEAERKAAATVGNVRHRLSAPATMRRIETLAAEVRGIERELTPCPASGVHAKHPEALGRETTCPKCYHRITLAAAADGDADRRPVVPVHGCLTGANAAHFRERLEQKQAEIAHWREHLVTLQAAGVRIWTKADLRKGDLVLTRHDEWLEVLRVNPKTVTVPTRYSWTDTIGYDRIRAVKRDGVEL